MAYKYKTRGFVFKKKDVNESDRIFSVFTDDFGRLDIHAKAIRKITSKLRNGIDIFSLSDIEFIQGKNRKTLTDASVIEKFEVACHGLEKFKIANGIAEIMDDFITGEEKDREIFNLLNESFFKLNGGAKPLQVYYYFLWSALSLLGYRPEVKKCTVCRENLDPFNICFSNKSGGVICKQCSEHDKDALKINSDIVKILRLIFSKEWQIVSKLKIEAPSQKLFEEISSNYYSYILSKK